MHKVFVYGTLLTGFGNWRSFLAPQEGVPSKVTGYKLFAATHGGFPYAVYTGDENDVVIGELFEVRNKKLENLDYLEGFHPGSPETSHYIRQIVHDHSDIPFIYCSNSERGNRQIKSQSPIESGSWREYKGVE